MNLFIIFCLGFIEQFICYIILLLGFFNICFFNFSKFYFFFFIKTRSALNENFHSDFLQTTKVIIWTRGSGESLLMIINPQQRH